MVALKGQEAERFVSSPGEDVLGVLVYGTDPGLVAERGKRLVSSIAGSVDDPFVVVRLSEDDLADDPARLADEARTLSLAGAKRVVWIRPVEARFARAFSSYVESPNPGTIIVAEAGILRPTNSVRKMFETLPQLIALPCYEDDTRSLSQLVAEQVEANGLAITDAAKTLLLRRLGANRAQSRSEIEKLCLFALGSNSIDTDDVEQITGDVSAMTLDRICDAVGEGAVGEIDHLFANALSAGNAPVQVLGALSRHFMQLHAMAARGSRSSSGNSRSSGPPIHFKRKPSVARQTTLWPDRELRKAIRLLARAELETRLPDMPAQTLVGRTLLNLATRASRRQRA